MDYRERITIDPLVRSGKPCIRGTRITVSDVLDYLGGGMTISEVLEDFPDLTARMFKPASPSPLTVNATFLSALHEVAL